MTHSLQDPDSIIIAVDIGGTKIAAALLTVCGVILNQSIEPTIQDKPSTGIDQIIRLIEGLVEHSAVRRERIIGIGIGIPAVLESQTDLIFWGPNLKGWKNVDLRGALESHFGLPVCIEYDGHTAVLGEWWMGAGKGHQSVVSVIIGTGVGGGMVLEGNLVRGFNRLAGAVGWFILDHPTSIDPTRERSLGSWEARVAGPGIARRAQYLLNTQGYPRSELAGLEGGPTAAQVFEAAQHGDPLAARIADEEAELLGMGIANIVSLVNPEIVILGGSVGSNTAFLLARVMEMVERFAQPFSAKSVEIVPSHLGVNAGLYGAAYGILLRLKS